MTSATDKAAARAAAHQRVIAELQAAGRHRDALAEAVRWARSEAAHAERLRPGDAPALYRQLTDRIASLAAAIPQFRPGHPGRERRH